MAHPVTSAGEGVPSPRFQPLDWLACAVTAICVLWSFDVPMALGLSFYTEQFAALVLGLVLALAFLQPPKGGRSRPRFYADCVLGGLGLVLGLYLAWRFPVLMAEAFFRPAEAFVVGAAACGLVLEATRRSTGIVLPMVFLILFLYGLFGSHLPGMLQGMAMPPTQLVSFLGLDASALFGGPMNIALTTVLCFIFFGRLLQQAGGAEFFTDAAAVGFGRFRGGTAKVSVVASSLFGMISGSAVANVVTTGVVTIPMMNKAGYRKETAGAVEAVSSTGGQLTPPVMGAAAFLMAQNLQVSYSVVAAAAIIPAILFYLSVFIQVDLEAARRNIAGAPAVSVDRRELLKGLLFLIPFAVLFVCLFSYVMPAEKAAIWAAIAVAGLGLVRGYNGKRLTARAIANAFLATGRDAIDIICICALSGMVIGALSITGLSLGLSLWMFEFGRDNLPMLLIAVAMLSILLGMGMPTAAVYLLVATLSAAPLIKLGVSGISAHMFVFYFGVLSMITPPVAIAAFAAASLAGTGPMKTAWRSCVLAWPAFVIPFTFVYSPELLLEGPALGAAIAVVTALAGVWLGSAGIIGYLFTPLDIVRRLLLFGSGLALLVPPASFTGGYVLNGVALLIGGAIVLFEATRTWRGGRMRSSATNVGQETRGRK